MRPAHLLGISSLLLLLVAPVFRATANKEMADGRRWSALAWQPAGKRLAVADERGQLRLWDTQRMT
jgi:hypothetical protein